MATESLRTVALAGPAAGGSSYVNGSGRLVIPAQTRTYPVIIRAADYNDKPLVPIVSQNSASLASGGTNTPHPISISGWTGIEFRGVEFWNDDTACAASTYWFSYGSLANAAFRQCYFRQTAQTLTEAQTGIATTIASMGNGGLWTNVTVEDCVFNRICFGWSPGFGSHDLTFQRNSILRLYNHFFEMNACSNLTIQNNLFDGFHPGWTAGVYDFHADTLLGFITGTMTWSGINYSSNFVIELRDHYRFSFQLENGTLASQATGITIANNVHIGGLDNPCFIINVGAATVTGNEFHAISGSSEVSNARIRAERSTLTISGNTTGWLDGGSNSITGTTPTDGTNQGSANYSGTAIAAGAATTLRGAFAALHSLKTQDDIA